jgi:predicted transcriptional regulator
MGARGGFAPEYAVPMDRRGGGLEIEGNLARIDAEAGGGLSVEIFKALGSEPRLSILRYLGTRQVPVNQIALDLGMPASTANRHIAMLEDAGLVHSQMLPATRGLQKVVARRFGAILVDLPSDPQHRDEAVEISMPIGAYTDFSVEPTCGLASASALIGLQDDPHSFYDPERIGAHLIWFRSGYVEYQFPYRVPAGSAVLALELSAEVCSEAPMHNPDWPSDISVWVNGTHLGEWTCPSDYGGQRGYLTPAWWPSANTQFGVQKRWRVGPTGTTIDGVALSDVRIDSLGLRPKQPITVRLGVRADARWVGGLNLFGRGFGNYPHDLELLIEHTEGKPDVA